MERKRIIFHFIRYQSYYLQKSISKNINGGKGVVRADAGSNVFIHEKSVVG